MIRRSDEGQATVELALVLPLLFTFFVGLFQAAVLARDYVVVVHAAREAARESAVTPDLELVRQAARRAGPLDPDRLDVSVRGRGAPGSRATAEVRYRARTDAPLFGVFLPDFTLGAEATMRVER